VTLISTQSGALLAIPGTVDFQGQTRVSYDAVVANTGAWSSHIVAWKLQATLAATITSAVVTMQKPDKTLIASPVLHRTLLDSSNSLPPTRTCHPQHCTFFALCTASGGRQLLHVCLGHAAWALESGVGLVAGGWLSGIWCLVSA
jgi:hypothetical protein